MEISKWPSEVFLLPLLLSVALLFWLNREEHTFRREQEQWCQRHEIPPYAWDAVLTAQRALKMSLDKPSVIEFQKMWHTSEEIRMYKYIFRYEGCSLEVTMDEPNDQGPAVEFNTRCIRLTIPEEPNEQEDQRLFEEWQAEINRRVTRPLWSNVTKAFPLVLHLQESDIRELLR